MKTEHFQASFKVITLGSIQIENNQIEKPSTKAWFPLDRNAIVESYDSSMGQIDALNSD